MTHETEEAEEAEAIITADPEKVLAIHKVVGDTFPALNPSPIDIITATGLMLADALSVVLFHETEERKHLLIEKVAEDLRTSLPGAVDAIIQRRVADMRVADLMAGKRTETVQ